MNAILASVTKTLPRSRPFTPPLPLQAIRLGVQRVESIDQVDFIKIGDYRCSFHDYIEFNSMEFGRNEEVFLPCKVPEQEPGLYTVSQRNKGPTGNAWKLTRVSFYHHSAGGYDFAVVPTIKSISSSKGSIKGQILTITGSGFSVKSTNEVKLGDTPCNVISQTSTEIVCELQARNDVNVPLQPFHSGLKWEYYANKKKITELTKRCNCHSSLGYDPPRSLSSI